jgi:hypothetical protein
VKTVRATLAASALLALPIPGVAWVTARVAVIDTGASISLPFRIAIAVSNWYTRLLPVASLIVLGAIVIIGLLLSRLSLSEKRRALLWWIFIAGATTILDMAIWWLPFEFLASNAAMKLNFISLSLSAFAAIAAEVLAAQVQGLVSKSKSSRIRGWHIAVCGTLLLFLGPLALLPPAWVLVTSRGVTVVER